MGSVLAETLYSPYPPQETVQRIVETFARHGLAVQQGGTQAVSAREGAAPARVLRVESPARVVDRSRCRWADAYGRPIELRIHRDERGVTWVEYALPPKRVNAFGIIECGKTHDDLVQAMSWLMDQALAPRR